MGFGIRILVAVLLSLISLSVLSLHIALCFHYPSSLFALTLLLNPSLWLFLGLLSMFCTLVLSYRDKRRKLVPALCTACRPKSDAALRFSSRRRCDCSRSYQVPYKKNLDRSLLTCHYSSYSSVHTTTHLLSNDSSTSEYPMKPQTRKEKKDLIEEDKKSLISLNSSSISNSVLDKEKLYSEEVQNYSCLSNPDSKGNTLVTLNREGQTKNFYINNNIFPQVNSYNLKENDFSSNSLLYNVNDKYNTQSSHSSVDSYSRILNADSVSSSLNTDVESSLSSVQPIKSYGNNCQTYHTHLKHQKLLYHESPSHCSSNIDNKILMRNQCTCPRRKSPAIKPEIRYVGKTNKRPVMKCTKSSKSITPIHLFRAKDQKCDRKDEESETIKRDDEAEDEVKATTRTNGSSTEIMIREPDTLTSIVSLLD